MKLANTLVYECGCSIPMSIGINDDEVKVNGYWAYESKICKKHSEQVLDMGRNWITTESRNQQTKQIKIR